MSPFAVTAARHMSLYHKGMTESVCSRPVQVVGLLFFGVGLGALGFAGFLFAPSGNAIPGADRQMIVSPNPLVGDASSHVPWVDQFVVPLDFETVDGGLGRACVGPRRRDHPEDSQPGISIDACTQACRMQPDCHGIQYVAGFYQNCTLWIGNVEGSVANKGTACLARTFSPSASAPTIDEDFQGVDGGEGRSCRQTGMSPPFDAYFLSFHAWSLEECKDFCKRADVCTGIEYFYDGYECFMWKTIIDTTEADPGKTCLRHDPSGFEAVDDSLGQEDQACVGVHEGSEEHMDYSLRIGNFSLYHCKVFCMQMQACSGIEHHQPSGTCKVWALAISSSRPSKGSRCLRYGAPGFSKGYHGGSGLACRGENEDDHTPGHFFTVNVATLHDCKIECARTDFCNGISFDHGRCEVWTYPVLASVVQIGSVCLQYSPQKTSSLFCASLMLPWGTEPDLLELQLQKKESIFACDDFAVYSSPQTSLGNGVYRTYDLDMDLHCKKGGKFNTYVNTPIFKTFWNHVIRDEQFKRSAWTAKVDPDAVFFPQRLRHIVQYSPSGYGVSGAHKFSGVFLNNCQLGLHGPLEVVSRRALEVFRDRRDSCEDPAEEDVYLRSCLLKIGVLEHDRWDVLAEQECKRGDFFKDPDWYKCNTFHAAFHPFKTVPDYEGCLVHAREAFSDR